MNKVNIGTHACTMDENGVLWISDFHFNGLFKYDLQKKKLKWIAQFPDVPVGAKRLHASAYIYADEVIFVPMYDTKVRIYNKSKNRVISLNIPIEESSTIFYNASVLIDDNLYFLSKDYRVWKCNLTQKNIVEDIELSNLCKENVDENAVGFSIWRSKIVFWQKNSKKVCELDLLRRTVKIVDVKIDFDAQAVFYEKGMYWFLLENSFDVFVWDGKNTTRIYKGEDNEWVDNVKIIPYGSICRVKNELYVLNQYSKYIMKIDEERKKLERVFTYPSGFEVLKQIGYGATYTKAYQYKENVLFVPQRGNMIFYYNEKKNDVEGYDFSIDKKEIPYWDKVTCERLEASDGLMETIGFVELGDYLDVVENISKCDRDKSSNIGIQIIEYLERDNNA